MKRSRAWRMRVGSHMLKGNEDGESTTVGIRRHSNEYILWVP